MRRPEFLPHIRSSRELFEQAKDRLPDLLAERFFRAARGVKISQENAFQREFAAENKEKLEDLKTVIRLVQDKLYPMLLVELKKAGVGISEEELRTHFLSREFFDRLVVYFGDAPRKGGGYSPDDHLVNLHYGEVFDGNGNLILESLVGILSHEYLHFVSDYEATHFVRVNEEETEIIPASGHHVRRMGYHMVMGEKNTFREMNEAVTEEYSRELQSELLASVKKDLPNFANLNIVHGVSNQDAKYYPGERRILGAIINYISQYRNVKYQIEWQKLKHGLLHGDILGNKDFRRLLKDCFGDDFFENFLNGFRERNPIFMAAAGKQSTEDILSALNLRFAANGGPKMVKV